MVEVLSESKGNLLGFRFSGKLTDKEYKETLIPKLEAVIKSDGKLRLLCYMDSGFVGWEMAAAWDDLTFWLKHKDDFSKLAVVGDSKWVEVGTKLSAHMMKQPLKVFHTDELQKAWEWVKA